MIESKANALWFEDEYGQDYNSKEDSSFNNITSTSTLSKEIPILMVLIVPFASRLLLAFQKPNLGRQTADFRRNFNNNTQIAEL